MGWQSHQARDKFEEDSDMLVGKLLSNLQMK